MCGAFSSWFSVFFLFTNLKQGPFYGGVKMGVGYEKTPYFWLSSVLFLVVHTHLFVIGLLSSKYQPVNQQFVKGVAFFSFHSLHFMIEFFCRRCSCFNQALTRFLGVVSCYIASSQNICCRINLSSLCFSSIYSNIWWSCSYCCYNIVAIAILVICDTDKMLSSLRCVSLTKVFALLTLEMWRLRTIQILSTSPNSKR